MIRTTVTIDSDALQSLLDMIGTKPTPTPKVVTIHDLIVEKHVRRAAKAFTREFYAELNKVKPE